MPRHNARRMVLATLYNKGPLTDAQLAWFVGMAKIKPGTAKSQRYKLMRCGRVRFANKVLRTSKGRLQELWELTPEAEQDFKRGIRR